MRQILSSVFLLFILAGCSRQPASLTDPEPTPDPNQMARQTRLELEPDSTTITLPAVSVNEPIPAETTSMLEAEQVVEVQIEPAFSEAPEQVLVDAEPIVSEPEVSEPIAEAMPETKPVVIPEPEPVPVIRVHRVADPTPIPIAAAPADPEPEAKPDNDEVPETVVTAEKDIPEPEPPLVIPTQSLARPVFFDQPKSIFNYSHEILFPDSAWDEYMIKKGDFLIKIAKQEYNDWRMWRQIYEWNREAIGPNPNRIYPYRWLDLLKPVDEVESCQLTYFKRKTRSGESLWTIAREVYHDELAWVVLYWDNEDILEASDGTLYPGMELQVREQIDPCNPKS